MTPKTLAVVKDYITKFEGYTTYFYQDTKANGTIGVGLLVADPSSAAAYGGDAAVAAWKQVVYESPGNMSAAWYSYRSPFRADPSILANVFATRLKAFESMVKTQFSGFDTWPQDVQVAVLDLVWNVGPALTTKWPHLSEALKAEDWKTAAHECVVMNGPVGRNMARQNLFLKNVPATT